MVQCPQTGFCSRQAVTLIELTKAPQFLFIQLLRFGNGYNGPKVTTLVRIDNNLDLPTAGSYEPISILSHRGATLAGGHYVNYMKIETGQWILFNDTIISLSSLENANTGDNYILLFKRKISVSTENKQEINTEKNTQNIEELDLQIKNLENKHSKNSLEKAELRKLKDKRRKKVSIQNETEEQCEKRKQKNRERMQGRRENETNEQYEKRKQKNKERMEERREKETTEQYERRKQKDKERWEGKRENESSEQYERRKQTLINGILQL